MSSPADHFHAGVNLKKRTTKVNAAMVIAVLGFWVAATFVVWHLAREQSDDAGGREEVVPSP